MIRYATIGTSSITENFIKATEQNDSEMTLAAVYSRSREKGEALSSKHGDVPVFCNMDELLKSELIDAVYIAVEILKTLNVDHGHKVALYAVIAGDKST